MEIEIKRIRYLYLFDCLLCVLDLEEPPLWTPHGHIGIVHVAKHDYCANTLSFEARSQHFDLVLIRVSTQIMFTCKYEPHGPTPGPNYRTKTETPAVPPKNMNRDMNNIILSAQLCLQINCLDCSGRKMSSSTELREDLIRSGSLAVRRPLCLLFQERGDDFA